MSFPSWLRHLRSALAPGESHRGRRASHRAVTHRPSLEVLEDRIVPAFLAPVDYAVGANPIDVKAGDFNGDGHLDLVTANYRRQQRQRAPGQRRRHVPAGSQHPHLARIH